MKKNTFKDYEKAIRAKYQIEKEGEYAKHFNPTAQANLRDLCWERFVGNKNEDDLSIFSSFFAFNFEINGTVRKKLRDETDRFRTIASFYLKEDRKVASRYAVELAAILVDFQPRPFKKFSEKGLILLDKPIEAPKFPLALKEHNSGEEDLNENYEEERAFDFENQLLMTNQESFLGNFKNRFSKKLKLTILAIVLVFGLGFVISRYVFPRIQCMQWSVDHYEKVDCEVKGDGFLSNKGVEPYDKNKFDLRKIHVYDTTTCFKNGEAIVWYAKTSSDKADFFNTHGRHPENNKPLRPVTDYIKKKYGEKSVPKK
ncbi:hypothetical protein D3C85_499230 [compost metagenome]